MNPNKTSEVMWGRANLNNALTINLSIPCIWRKYKKKCSQETVVCDIKNVMLYIILAIMAYSQKPFTKRLKMWAFDTGATFLPHPHVNYPRSWLEREYFQKYGIPRDLYHISLRLGVYTTKMSSLSDLKSEVQCQGICFLWKFQRMTFPASPSL